jgi:hypothetical protein
MGMGNCQAIPRWSNKGYVKREHALSYEYNVYALTRMHEPPLTGMFCVVHTFQLLPYGRHIWSLAPIKQFCSICVPFRLSGSRGHSGGMGPQRILWGLGRRAWGLRGSCGHSGGAHGASADPVGTREARMGPQRILWGLGRRA